MFKNSLVQIYRTVYISFGENLFSVNIIQYFILIRQKVVAVLVSSEFTSESSWSICFEFSLTGS